jgi:hypothetical protein
MLHHGCVTITCLASKNCSIYTTPGRCIRWNGQLSATFRPASGAYLPGRASRPIPVVALPVSAPAPAGQSGPSHTPAQNRLATWSRFVWLRRVTPGSGRPDHAERALRADLHPRSPDSLTGQVWHTSGGRAPRCGVGPAVVPVDCGEHVANQRGRPLPPKRSAGRRTSAALRQRPGDSSLDMLQPCGDIRRRLRSASSGWRWSRGACSLR